MSRSLYKSLVPKGQIWKIRPHLYLGNLNTLDMLDDYNIHMIFSLLPAENYLPENIMYERRVAYCEIDDSPHENIIKCANFMIPLMVREIRNGHNILVHCHAGISRSVSILIAYLMVVENLSFDEALFSIRKVRPEANPNDGFVNQLKMAR